MNCDVSNSLENLYWIESLRKIDFEESFREVREFSDRRVLVEKARDAIDLIMWHIAHTLGVPFESKEPGHGIGHMFRDFLNGCYAVYHDKEYDPRELFIGLIAGTLHDVGCLLVERYQEKHLAIRHSEAGAILVNEACRYGRIPLNKHEIDLVCYAIAAHTFYRRSFEVVLDSGEQVTVMPYSGHYSNNHPMNFLWMTRWIDRLDTAGPGFVARHFLTLNESHSDYDHAKQKFFDVDFVGHLKPLMRDNPPADKTMLEHVHMFAENQLNPEIVGVMGQGVFARLRDNQIVRNRAIVQAVLHPKELDRRQTEDNFLSFLCNQVEPSAIGIITSQELMKRFANELDQESRHAWNNGFLACMRTYEQWGEEMYEFSKEFSKEFFWIGNLRSLNVL